jgi:hypothetical protein
MGFEFVIGRPAPTLYRIPIPPRDPVPSVPAPAVASPQR